MSSPTDVSVHARPAFASIVCGVDDSRTGFEAARQAAILCGDAAALTYVSVSWEQGTTGTAAVAALTHDHAHQCLRRVRDQARELGPEPALLVEHASDPAQRLLELAEGQDLLVVGTSGHSRPGGIMVGSAATCSVLVIRPRPAA